MEQLLVFAVGRLLTLSGVEIGECLEGPVTTSPLEPLQDEPPALWIRCAAFHLAEINRNCGDVLGDLDDVASALAGNQPSSDGVWSSLWGAISDMRFHTFAFPLYADMIRERLLSSPAMHCGTDLIPSSALIIESREFPCEAFVSSESLGEEMTKLLGVLQSVAGGAASAIKELAMSAEADLPALAKKFTNVQQVLLELALVILRADAVSGLLMYRLEDE